MKIMRKLTKLFVSIFTTIFLVACGGGDGGGNGGSANVNNNGVVSASNIQAQVMYDGSWRYLINGVLTVSLGQNVQQINITGIKIKIGNQPEQTYPYSYVVQKSADGITQEELPLSEINIGGDYISKNESRTITLTPVGTAIGGSSFVGNSTTVSIQGFQSQELLATSAYTIDIVQSKSEISSFGENNIGIHFTLKNELGAIDTTTKLRINSPSSINGLTYPSAFTTNRTFYINFPTNTTSSSINYQFIVELESDTSSGVSKTISSGNLFSFTQNSSFSEIPFNIKSNSGIESVEDKLSNLTANGNMFIDLSLTNNNYDGNTLELSFTDITNGGSLPLYKDTKYNIIYGQDISLLVNKDAITGWPTNAQIVNTSANSRELLAEIKILNGTTIFYKYTQVVNQEGNVNESTDKRTLSKINISNDLKRYKNTTGNTIGYFTVQGDFAPFNSTMDEYKDYEFTAQIIDPDNLVNISQTYIGGMLWNNVTSNSSLMNFNNSNITLSTSNTIKFDISFNDTTNITTNKEVSILFFGEDGNFIEYKIPVLAQNAPFEEQVQYVLTGTNSTPSVGPTLPSGTNLFFNLEDTTGMVNTPILNFKLSNNKDYINLTGGTVQNTTTEKIITVPVTNQSYATVGIEQLLENTSNNDINIPYLAYITVNDKIVSNILDGSSIKVLSNNNTNATSYNTNLVLPTQIVPTESGSITYSFNLNSGTTPITTPMLQIDVLNNGSYITGLPASNISQQSGILNLVANSNNSGQLIPVELAYYVTADSKIISDIKTATINVMPNRADPLVRYSVNAVTPSQIVSGKSGSATFTTTLTSGTTTSTPLIHLTILEGSQAASLSSTTITEAGSIGLITTSGLLDPVTVQVGYYATIDGKSASELSSFTFTVNPAP